MSLDPLSSSIALPVAPSAPVKTAIALPVAPLAPDIPGFTVEDIQSMTFTHLRTADLPENSYWWLLLPVIGWLVFICLKSDSDELHKRAEQEMAYSNCSERPDVKLDFMPAIKRTAGRLAWQYNLDAAKWHLLNNNPKAALGELQNYMQMKGIPSSPHYRYCMNLGLVSPHLRQGVGGPSDLYLGMTTHSSAEARLAAAVFSANKQYLAAYEALNDLAYWTNGRSVYRRQQELILGELVKEEGSSPREVAILIAEFEQRKKAQQARSHWQSSAIKIHLRD